MLTSIDVIFLLSLRCFCENSEYKWEQLVPRRGTFSWKRKKEQTLKARIHTGFHCFTEIGQIFDKKSIF